MVSNAPGRDHQQPLRACTEQMPIAKVTVLGDHDPGLGVGQLCDRPVLRLLPSGIVEVWIAS